MNIVKTARCPATFLCLLVQQRLTHVRVFSRMQHVFQVLEVLARNVEANRHLFAHQRPSPADTATVSNTRGAAVSGQSRGGLHEAASADASSGGSRSNNSCCPIEGEVEGRHVVAVRKLDWFTFAAQETDMDEASCELAEDGVEVGLRVRTFTDFSNSSGAVMRSVGLDYSRD